MPIRAMCGCGYPYNPDRSYDGTRPWSGRKPRQWCSKRCARSIPAQLRRLAKTRQRRRDHLAAWEAAGQLTLW